MNILTLCAGVFALFHSVTSVILLLYFQYAIDEFMAICLAGEFIIGIAILYTFKYLNTYNK